jgi:hypothetical protein
MTDIVTTEKPKNPGRQEWGRKLGKMSKELKLKKNVQVESEPIESKDSSPILHYLKFEYVVGISAIILTALALYYQKKSFDSDVKQSSMPHNDLQPERPQFSDF